MKNIQQWFDEYGESHQNRFNKMMHWICVPLIFFSIIGLLSTIPVPNFMYSISPMFHWGTIILILGLTFYLRLSFPMFLGMLLVSAITVVGNYLLALATAGLVPYWSVCLIIFALAWVGQFWGHNVEGKKPSFFKDLQFLLIGPAWLLGFIYKSLGLKY